MFLFFVILVVQTKLATNYVVETDRTRW